MNKAVRTFVIMGLILLGVFIVCAVTGYTESMAALYFAIGFFVIAFGIRFLGYVIRHDKLRKKTS